MSVSEIIDALNFLKEVRKKSYKELTSDRVLVSAVLWNLYTAIQGCIDLGLKVIGHLELRDANSYSDVFNVLQEYSIISKGLSERLKNMAKFRNVLAHLYATIDLRKVYHIIQNNLDDIRDFLKELKKNLECRNIQLEDL